MTRFGSPAAWLAGRYFLQGPAAATRCAFLIGLFAYSWAPLLIVITLFLSEVLAAKKFHRWCPLVYAVLSLASLLALRRNSEAAMEQSVGLLALVLKAGSPT
jgi:hypothetical protein